MKKPYTHTDLSTKKCKAKGCEKKLKLNVLARKPDAELCYKHWTEQRRQG